MDLARLPETGRKLIQRVTQRSSSNFKFAFVFLGAEQRDALASVYGFCRIVDDIVDERAPGPAGVEEAARGLASWREEVAAIYHGHRPPGTDAPFPEPAANGVEPKTKLGRQLQAQLQLFPYPREAFLEIIEGCAMDLERDRYANMAELELYCYRVASCVGRLCIAIFGDVSEGAELYARHLGLALQYTNILRDVGEDAARGRVYLPLDLLERHGLRDVDILQARYDAAFLAMAEEFSQLAEREYEAARMAFEQCGDRTALVAAEVMGRTYHQILEELQAREFNVFAHRPGLKRRDKLRVAARAIMDTHWPSTSKACSGTNPASATKAGRS